MKYATVLCCFGSALVAMALLNQSPGDETEWWTPVMFFGALMIFVGIGRLVKPHQKAGRS